MDIHVFESWYACDSPLSLVINVEIYSGKWTSLCSCFWQDNIPASVCHNYDYNHNTSLLSFLVYNFFDFPRLLSYNIICLIQLMRVGPGV